MDNSNGPTGQLITDALNVVNNPNYNVSSNRYKVPEIPNNDLIMTSQARIYALKKEILYLT